MPLNPTYSAGTVSVTAGGTTVTGNLTLWLAAGIREGDVFECRGLTATIENVNSSTSITLVRPWFGATVTGSEYEIRYIADASRVIGAARTVVERFEALQPVFDGAYASYANLLEVAPTLSPTVRAIEAVVDGQVARWVRDASGTALGGGWKAAERVAARNFGGSLVGSHATGSPVEYSDRLWPGDEPNSYFNIYGATKYRTASYDRVQLGRDGSPVNDPKPMWVVQKFSSADRSVDSSAWDQAGYYAIQARSGDAYRAALTGFTRAFAAAGGDHIGVHGRSDVRSSGSRGYGVWAYGADLTSVGNAAACHAGEFNGQSLNDPGYGSDHQCLRLCMADSATAGNRFGSALNIGNPTHGGEAGFHQGIWVQSNAILGSAGLDGEAMRVDARTNNTAGATGGIRFAKASTTHTGVFKYALRTDEAAFTANEAVIMASGQRVSWFVSGSRTTSIVGGSTSVTVNASNGIAIPDVAANGVGVSVGGQRVLSTRQAAIPNATAGTEVATLNAILNVLRVHGLISS